MFKKIWIIFNFRKNNFFIYPHGYYSSVEFSFQNVLFLNVDPIVLHISHNVSEIFAPNKDKD